MQVFEFDSIEDGFTLWTFWLSMIKFIGIEVLNLVLLWLLRFNFLVAIGFFLLFFVVGLIVTKEELSDIFST